MGEARLPQAVSAKVDASRKIRQGEIHSLEKKAMLHIFTSVDGSFLTILPDYHQ